MHFKKLSNAVFNFYLLKTRSNVLIFLFIEEHNFAEILHGGTTAFSGFSVLNLIRVLRMVACYET